MKVNDFRRQSLLSTLWVFVLFNMIFRDLHQFANKGFLESLNALEVTEELVLIFGFVVEIPILMVLLSRVLPDRINKWSNLVAAVITLLGLASSLATADMDDIFFFLIECAAIAAIGFTAWQLPSTHSKKVLA